MKFEFLQMYEHYCLTIADNEDKLKILLDFPVKVQLYNGKNLRVRYDTVDLDGAKYVATAKIQEPGVCNLLLTDIWEEIDGQINLQRRVKSMDTFGCEGIRFTSEFRVHDHAAASFDDYSLVFPGAFYNKNDSDEDGIDDYLGTFEQDYKDDRNPGLSETLWCRNSKKFVSLIRADVPTKDETVSREMVNERTFILDTDIGSLGFSPSMHKVNEVVLRCDYPFCERNSFCLNVDASGWSAYKRISGGEEISWSYILFSGTGEDLTEAAWKTTVFQMNRILNDDIKLLFTMEESMACRRNLVHNSYREFPEKKDFPAGYFIHFSPRGGYGKNNILEYGFAGQQQMLSYAMLRAAKDLGSAEHRRRAIQTLDFFCKRCVHESGIPYGLYDVNTESFIYWWTGVLFPFQYSQNREQLEKYLGKQVVSAMLPIAAELCKHQGNYTRTMIESMYYLWLCYKEELAAGIYHEDWKNCVLRFCDKFLEIQNPDGSWNRAYTMDGQAILEPVEWFGCNDLERGSGAIFPIELISQVYEETQDTRYMRACIAAADFIRNNMVESVYYVGGLNDTTHKKSVKLDAVGVMFAMRSLLRTYEITADTVYLSAAAKAAQILGSWTYLWDIPFNKGTTLGDHGFKTTGWAGCDVIPACSYVDDEFAEFVPDVLKIAELTQDIYLAKLAKIVYLGMQHGLSTSKDMYGYQMEGVQCEGYMTSLWLTDSVNPDFSGAVSKMKGDDNDTCNGLVNGQQLVTVHVLRDMYGTIDINKIMKQAGWTK